MHKRSIVTGLVFACGLLSSATAATVTVTAEAEIIEGNVDQAVQTARARGMQLAVEKAIGIYIQQEFTATQREAVANKQVQFNSMVQDKLVKRSTGYIKDHTVKNTTQIIVAGKPFIQLTMEADVYQDKVTAELRRLTDLIKAAGNPKLMVAIQVLYRETDNTLRVHSTPQLPGLLAKELLDLGFEVVGKGPAASLVQNSPDGFKASIAEPSHVIALARKERADIVIGGVMEIVDRGTMTDTGPFTALKGQVRLEIKTDITAIHVATGRVFSSEPLQRSTMGINAERALTRELRGRSRRHNNLTGAIATRIVTDARALLEQEANVGLAFQILLHNATSHRKHCRPFLALLRSLGDKVASVREVSYDNGVLTTELTFKGKPKELEDLIYAAVDGGPAVLKALDKKAGAGRRIEFTL